MYLISLMVAAIISNICFLYIGSTILRKKINYKNKYIIFAIIINVIILQIISVSFNNFFRIFLNYLLFGLFCKAIFRENINKSFTLSLVFVIYYFISEVVFSLFLVFLSIFINFNMANTPINYMIINISITIIVLLLTDVKSFNKIIQKIVLSGQVGNTQEIIIAIIFGIGILAEKNLSFLGLSINYATNIIMLLIFFIIIYFLFKEKENSIVLSRKYDQLLNYIQKYELELTKKSMTIHEFKNQIIVIKGFIPQKNKKFNKYVDSIMSELKNLENNLLSDMEYIPKGGLKGLIYFKLGDLKEKGINVVTSIDPKMKKTAFNSSDAEQYKDILKIIGIYLDNAIEAVINAFDKQIVMEMYCKNKESHFILSNTYSKNFDIDKIGDLGYSTKGKNRGYGLQLVKKILYKNENIIEERNISEKHYSVHLVVKNKI